MRGIVIFLVFGSINMVGCKTDSEKLQDNLKKRANEEFQKTMALAISTNMITVDEIGIFTQKFVDIETTKGSSAELGFAAGINSIVLIGDKNRMKEVIDDLNGIKKLKRDSLQIESDFKKNNPKAYKIHNKHPEWAIEDCMLLAEDKIWIGMSLDMLKYQRGKPNSANPSSYGNGVKWQWCWSEYTPSCFYDDNNDGLVDSFN